jgi:hypothetical protein
MADDNVLTPGGYRPRSVVHRVEPGHKLDGAQGRLRTLDPSGAVLADHVARRGAVAPALGSGWIVYADWSNTTGTPVSRFATTWTVPPAPATQSGQTIFLFNGIQNSTMIYQPVLQWGPSAAGGGNYWAVASWYADGQGGQAFYTSLVQVNPGDVLVGVMTLTGQAGAAFNYDCNFQGIANTDLPIQNVDELTWCAETLEAYSLTQCSDYPNTADTAMTNIALQTGGTSPTLTWTAVNAVTDCGQQAIVASNANPGGEVDLYYRPPVLWQSNLTVGQTFATNDSENAWAYFENVGWRRILPGSTDGVTNMLSLFALAEAKNLQVTVYADSSNVYQAYLL